METTHYLITIRGRPGATLLGEFAGMDMAPEGADTVISGPIVDQASLFGVLELVESLGLELLEVRRTMPAR